MKHPLRSLAARITLLVFAATVLSALAVSWISVQSLDGFLRRKVDQRFPHVAERIAHELDQWYALRAREIEVFAGSAILVESTPTLTRDDARGRRARREAEQYLRYVLASFPQFRRLALATPEGRPLIEVGDDEALPEVLVVEATHALERTHISDAQPLGDRLVQVAAVPMRNAEADTIGWLYALIDLADVEPILSSAELGANARVLLVDVEQRFLNRADGVARDARYRGHRAIREAGSSVAYYEDPLGRRVIGASEPVPRFGWTLVIEQPYEEAFAPVVVSMSRVAGLNVVIVLFVGLAAYRIARSIVEPLRELSTAAKRLSIGEREVEIDETPGGTDEVRLLTRTFNEMSRGLGRSARELEENHRALESANEALRSKNEELSNVNLVLEQLSITDGLTKLHNHRYFQDALVNECKRARRTDSPLCLVLIDIDYFKKWNDRLGHAGGDEILRRMAEVLNATCRQTDLLARYGGEEFAVLAVDTDLAGATALAEKIRQVVESTNFLTDVPSEREPITVSVGVAAFDGDRKRLFTDTDAALYAAKDAGRNRVVAAEA